jgi:WD40 repeat protein
MIIKKIIFHVHIQLHFNDGKTTTVTASNLKMEIIGCVCSVSPNGNYVVLSACKDDTTEVWDSEPMAMSK